MKENGRLPAQIRITTLHKTAVWIARRSGQSFEIAGPQQRQKGLDAARTTLQPRGLGDAALIPTAAILANLRDDYLLDEFDWVIEGQNCRSEADYLAAIRAGRGIPFPTKTRQAVHADLNVSGRTRILRRNYRSTRQIAAAAADIMAPVPDFDAEALQQEYLHVGLPPLLYAADGSEEQARWIARQIVQSARFMSSSQFDLAEPCIKVTTLHAAKGLEFPIVVVAHVEAGRLPRETEATDPDEAAAHELGQRRLFYVGCTRAMRHLFVTYDRQLPSPFLTGLSDERWQREG